MQISEPFLPFSHNLLYKRLRFDEQLDLIENIMPLDEKTCLMIDRSWNYHIKSYSPEDEEYASRQFPLPSYAHNRNSNVLYSVEYLDLYHYLYPQNHTYHFDEENLEYAQFVHLGDCRIAIQFDRFNPVALLDLHRPNDPPVILQDVYGVDCLDAGGEFLVWYEKRTGLVFLYHGKLKKRKILNFSKRQIEGLCMLKDHVIIAVSKRNLEVLDYRKNKRIKSVGFMNEDVTPGIVFHCEGNIISYIDEGHIHALKTEKGKIKWESKYDLRDYEKDSAYAFITHNLIALETKDTIHILLLDSHTFSLHTVVQHPWLGFLETPDLTILCCERAQKKGMVLGINPLWGNRFAVVECVCRTHFFWHGHQRVSLFSLENLRSEDLSDHPQPGVTSIKFNLRKSILFEGYRDPVRAIDILDETLAMFITERGKIFQVNLKDCLMEYAIELSGLLKKNSNELTKIDKFFALRKNKVAIITRRESSSYIRIAVFSLETRDVDWDSIGFEENVEDQVLFYDVIKFNPDRLILTYKRNIDNQWRYLAGELFQEECRYDLCDFVSMAGVAYDRLWNLGGSFFAMRHASNVFDLSFMYHFEDGFRVKQKFSAEKYLTRAQIHVKGILDVKLITKDVVCIQLKMKTFEMVVLVYNLRTEEFLNQIKTDLNIVGTIKQFYTENDLVRSIEKMIVFGYNGAVDNGLIFKSVQDITTKKINSILKDDENQNLRISSNNFQALFGEDQVLVYENDCHKNFICLLKSPNFKLECLRILRKGIGNNYHKYIYKNIVDMIFGVKQ